MGTIADLYDHMGGKVVILGKPSKEIYLKSCKQLDQIDKSKTIAVGDSLDHDILGASNFGVDSVLITSGIHKDLFKNGIEKGIKNIENDRKFYEISIAFYAIHRKRLETYMKTLL